MASASSNGRRCRTDPRSWPGARSHPAATGAHPPTCRRVCGSTTSQRRCRTTERVVTAPRAIQPAARRSSVAGGNVAISGLTLLGIDGLAVPRRLLGCARGLTLERSFGFIGRERLGQAVGQLRVAGGPLSQPVLHPAVRPPLWPV